MEWLPPDLDSSDGRCSFSIAIGHARGSVFPAFPAESTAGAPAERANSRLGEERPADEGTANSLRTGAPALALASNELVIG